jgi:xanthine dehydrogenase accessory factor
LGELGELAAAAEAWRAEGVPTALATVVAVRGSAYRRPGAKMLLGSDGRMQGSVSGGCLEPELLAVAERVLADGRDETATYDLSEDAMWGLGIGCGGEVRVHVAPLDPELPAVWRRVEDAAQAWAVVQPLVGHGALRIGPGEDGPAAGAIEGVDVACAAARARGRLVGVQSGVETLADGREVFVDVMAPPPLLCVFGAGHDAMPVSALAQRVGMRVRVIDPRPAYATPERFPGAEVVRTDVRAALGDADAGADARLDADALVPPGAYSVVMHHHLERDRAALALLARSRARYVGALGPRSRTERLLGELAAQGVDLAALRAVLASPVGLDIGAEGPDAIAVSIVAELLAVRAGRGGGRLAAISGSVHGR